MKFLLTIIFGGLAQIWIILLYSYFQQNPQTLIDLLSQSGIFFFSTSLAATSLWKYSKVFSRVSKNESFVSFAIFCSILAVSLTAIFSGLELDHQSRRYIFTSNSNHANFAIGCLITSLAYSLLAESKISKYSKL